MKKKILEYFNNIYKTSKKVIIKFQYKLNNDTIKYENNDTIKFGGDFILQNHFSKGNFSMLWEKNDEADWRLITLEINDN